MRKLKGKFTTILNDYITDGKIDACEFRILCYLCKLANEENSCYPSQSTIAKNTHISLTKVKKSVKHLVELEMIATTNRFKNNGSNDTNIYVVCDKTDTEVATSTGDSVSKDLPGSVCADLGRFSDGYNKYINNNTYNFINTYHLSIENVLEQAETENLTGLTRKNFESAIEIMYNSKSISVGGQSIPQAEVHRKLENISYEHIVYVDNNIPRNIDTNHNIEINVRNPVPYIVTALYNSLKYTKDEIIELEFGDQTQYQNSS